MRNLESEEVRERHGFDKACIRVGWSLEDILYRIENEEGQVGQQRREFAKNLAAELKSAQVVSKCRCQTSTSQLSRNLHV